MISIIMPCYNHGNYIEEAITSILNQNFPYFELIIIDDYSIDNTKEIILEYKQRDKRIKAIFNKKNYGPSVSRNIGLLSSSENLIAFCDADDIWLRNKLEIQINILKYNKNIVCFTDSFVIKEDGKYTGRKFSDIYHKKLNLKKDIFDQLCLTNFINMQTVIHHKCHDKKVKFSPAIKYCEDWLYWHYLSKTHHFLYIDEPLAKYRIHSKSTNKNKIMYAYSRIYVYHNILQNKIFKNEMKSKIFYQLGNAYCEVNDRSEALICFLKSTKHDKKNVKAWLKIIFLIVNSKLNN